MRKVIKLTSSDKRYEQELHQAVDTIFDYAAYVCSLTWSELAQKAGLDYSTVHRLGSRITVRPQHRTLCRLAWACGLKLKFVDSEGTAMKPRAKVAA